MLTPRLHRRIALRRARHHYNCLPTIITRRYRCAIAAQNCNAGGTLFGATALDSNEPGAILAAVGSAG